MTQPKSPSFPQIKSTTTGFPEHKKRTRISTFKSKRQGAKSDEKAFTTASKEPLPTPLHNASPPTQPSRGDLKQNEFQGIDRENNERLASMSPEEIEEARRELFSGLDQSTLEMLLKRANLDEASNSSPFDQPNESSTGGNPSEATRTQDPPKIQIEDTSDQPSVSAADPNVAQSPTTSHSKRVHFASVADEDEEEKATTAPLPQHTPTHKPYDDDAAPSEPPKDYIIDPNAPNVDKAPLPKPHWPHPPQPADLDPHDPNFLQLLHEKYFPQLPADPSKLAWMAPVPTPNSIADHDSPYHPSQSSLPVSALRFDFRGLLLPPRISRAVPVTKGLHHHGEAPEAAGYTVRELARLCRSAVPGQRCVAYQTLGRVLYRLGRGEYGGAVDAVPQGLWAEFEEGAVLRSLYEEAATEEGRGHRSARAFAIEAIWLFEKGGWKERMRKGR